MAKHDISMGQLVKWSTLRLFASFRIGTSEYSEPKSYLEVWLHISINCDSISIGLGAQLFP